MNIDVGAHLRAVRKMHGLSQRELAKRAGVTNGTISLIEQNRVSPSVSSLRKVLAGIPMSLGDFFTTDFSDTGNVFYGADELAEIGSGAGALTAAERTEITDIADEYVSLLRHHIQKEDGILFEMADRMLPPAEHLRLSRKGRIAVGADADLVALDAATLAVSEVWSAGMRR